MNQLGQCVEPRVRRHVELMREGGNVEGGNGMVEGKGCVGCVVRNIMMQVKGDEEKGLEAKGEMVEFYFFCNVEKGLIWKMFEAKYVD